MKARKQMRKFINRMRRKYAPKNGVLPIWVFDFGARGPWTDKRNKKPRHKTAENWIMPWERGDKMSERYWEERWRDEAAKVARLYAAFRRIEALDHTEASVAERWSFARNLAHQMLHD